MTDTSIVEKVAKTLTDNNFQQWADKIDTLAKKIENGTKADQISAAKEIQGFCHIRSLGDFNIRTISGTEWLKDLEKLKKYARKKASS